MAASCRARQSRGDEPARRDARRHAGDLRHLRHAPTPRPRGEEAWADYTALVAPARPPTARPEPPGLTRTREAFLRRTIRRLHRVPARLRSRRASTAMAARQPIAVNVQGSVFMHAGAAPRPRPCHLRQSQRRGRDEVRRLDRFVERLVAPSSPRPWFRLRHRRGRRRRGALDQRADRGRQAAASPTWPKSTSALVAEAEEILGIDRVDGGGGKARCGTAVRHGRRGHVDGAVHGAAQVLERRAVRGRPHAAAPSGSGPAAGARA